MRSFLFVHLFLPHVESKKFRIKTVKTLKEEIKSYKNVLKPNQTHKDELQGKNFLDDSLRRLFYG